MHKKRLKPGTSKILVMDDETYCPIDPNNITGSKFYSVTNNKSKYEQFKFKLKPRFLKEYLIWQALDSLGNISKPSISTSTMNSERYLKDCVKKRLIPFINNRDVLFWPDMATCHYSASVFN